MSRAHALSLAAKYNLENEVADYIDNLGFSPIDACYEWDIL